MWFRNYVTNADLAGRSAVFYFISQKAVVIVEGNASNDKQMRVGRPQINRFSQWFRVPAIDEALKRSRLIVMDGVTDNGEDTASPVNTPLPPCHVPQ